MQKERVFAKAVLAIALSLGVANAGFVVMDASEIDLSDIKGEKPKMQGKEKQIAEQCNREMVLGVRSSMSALVLSGMSQEEKSKSLLYISGMYSAFYHYCVSFYRADDKLLDSVPAEMVLKQFIADSITLQNKNDSDKELK